MFKNIKRFWQVFFYSLKEAYAKVYKNPPPKTAKDWRDITGINFLAIFVNVLGNLCCTEMTADIVSDSAQTDELKPLCDDLENHIFNIFENTAADGDYFVFPATDAGGNLVHSYLTQDRVRILGFENGKITSVCGVLDNYIDGENNEFYLLRMHELQQNGNLEISYMVLDDRGQSANVEKWDALKDAAYVFPNARHIGIGRYKSPKESRGHSGVYGVPLNFDCADIEAKINHDLKLIEDEYNNGKSVVFTDPRNLMRDDEARQYRITDNIIPIKNRSGEGSNIEIFNPNIRTSEHYTKLTKDLETYERIVGTSKGILTENETAYTATATAVKRSNADTIALLDKFRRALDEGNKMTLEADAVYLNITSEWEYVSDWYDPFEDPSDQWQRLVEGKQNGAAETADLVRWLFPKLSPEEIDEKIQRIKGESEVDTEAALERMLRGA